MYLAYGIYNVWSEVDESYSSTSAMLMALSFHIGSIIGKVEKKKIALIKFYNPT
jgi:hypothetical protein